MRIPRVITVMNQKGCVGKTTTTLNVGASLAHLGKRVLLIDLDPQANLTHGLSMLAKDLSESVYELLLNPHVVASNLIQSTPWPGLDIVPSHIDLSGAEIELVPVMGRETRLARALAPVRDRYDYVFIDCLPSLSLLTVNAMVAANEALVPLQAHPFALEGLGKLFEVVGMLREALNPDLRVSAVLVTLFDSRTNVNRETLKRLQGDLRLAPHLLGTLVRNNIKIAESQKDGVPVLHYDAACAGAKAYLRVAEELLEMERSGCLASEAAKLLEKRERAEGKPAHREAADDDAPARTRAKRASASKPEAPAEEPAPAPAEASVAAQAGRAIHEALHAAPPAAPEPVPAPHAEAEASNRFPHAPESAAPPESSAQPQAEVEAGKVGAEEERTEPVAGPLRAPAERIGTRSDASLRPRLHAVPYHGTRPVRK